MPAFGGDFVFARLWRGIRAKGDGVGRFTLSREWGMKKMGIGGMPAFAGDSRRWRWSREIPAFAGMGMGGWGELGIVKKWGE